MSTTTATYRVISPSAARAPASRASVRIGHRSPLAPIELIARALGPRVQVTAGNLGAGCEAFVSLTSTDRIARQKWLSPGAEVGHWGHQLTFKALTPGAYVLHVSTLGSRCAHPGHATTPVTIT